MTGLRLTAGGTAAVVLFLALWFPATAGQAGEGQDRWRQAVSARVWDLPRDHGAHPGYRTEWWYFTGVLADEKGHRFGYQLTFFRVGVRQRAETADNPWSVTDLYLAHAALTDVSGGLFLWRERLSRTGPDLAGAAQNGLRVWLWDWSAEMDGGVIHLLARDEDLSLDLTLTPTLEPVLHGEGGVSRKGPGEGQASYYYSWTQIDTSGSVRVKGGPRRRVRGKSWFDHEFGSNQLAADQEGWDWFGLNLSDGSSLMVYLIRRTDGALEPDSSGTWVTAEGTAVPVDLSMIEVTARDVWRSRQSGAEYPSGWWIRIPDLGLELSVDPLLRGQELATTRSAGIIYWEGAVSVSGRSRGRPLTGTGYVELTGYAGSLGGVF